ncbi:MAG: translation initiation factor IF-3 [Bacteroidota bacterium]
MVLRNYRRYKKREEPYRINDKILAPEVRIVGENVQTGVYPIQVARKIAQENGLDLVEIAPSAMPPVCSIVNYTKFKYQRKKKEKELKAKTKKIVKKEIKLTLNTDIHDISFKQKHAIKFLQDGAMVDVYVQLRGREMKYKERGTVTLQTFLENLKPYGAVLKYPPKQIGRRFMMTIELDKKRKNT